MFEEFKKIRNMSAVEIEKECVRLRKELDKPGANEDENYAKRRMYAYAREIRFSEFRSDLGDYIVDFRTNKGEEFKELLSKLVVRQVVEIKPNDYYFGCRKLKFYAYSPVSRYFEILQKDWKHAACQSYIWQDDPDFERLEKGLVDGKVVIDLELVNEESLHVLWSETIKVFAFYYRRDGSFEKAALGTKEFMEILVVAEKYWSVKVDEELYRISLKPAS